MNNSDILLDVIGDIDTGLIPVLNGPVKKAKIVVVKRGLVAVTCAAAVITGAVFMPRNNKTARYDSYALSRELPMDYNSACFVINVNAPEEVVGWADYVFVARVDEELRTEYDKVRINEKGTMNGMPYTYYRVKVVENIKGSLKTNEPIELFKHGGVNIDGKSISVLEGDEMLETGKYYIIIASAERDGRLGQGTPNSNIRLSISDTDMIENCAEYIAYKDYVKNEIPFERERFHSVYEESST